MFSIPKAADLNYLVKGGQLSKFCNTGPILLGLCRQKFYNVTPWNLLLRRFYRDDEINFIRRR